MITTSDRVKKIRNHLDMTQQDFADRIGLRRNSLSQIETGTNGVTEQTIKAICREYNVNEEWLRTGEGEMFMQTDDDILTAVTKEIGLDEFGVRALRAYLKLTPAGKAIMKDYILSIAAEYAETKSNVSGDKEDPEVTAARVALDELYPEPSELENEKLGGA